METKVSGLWLLAVAVLLTLSTSGLAQSHCACEVSDSHWGRSTVVTVTAHSSPVDRGQATNYPPISEASARFRNTGTKAIKSVTWKYAFWKDEQRTQVFATYTFHSSKRIEPGASVRLQESVSALSEPRRWTNYQGVIISRIDYVDGTTWQAKK